MMRSLAALVTALLVAPSAFAQTHHHGIPFSLETPEPIAVASTGVTRTYSLTARQWAFSFSPSPFVANVGDTVVINGSSLDVQHLFLLERYYLKGLTLNKGQTSTATFVVDQAGTFQFICNQPTCGAGHSNMNGEFVVSAAAPSPTIASIQPPSGNAGTAVTITGTNFQSGATVKFGEVGASSVSVESSTTIVATAPAQTPASVAITVTNPDGQSATSGSFTYDAPFSVVSVAPASGSNAGGSIVSIIGTGFAGSSATVTFGGIAATNVTILDSTTITAKTPAHANGVVDVTVTVGTRTITAAAAFTYEDAPARRRTSGH